MKKNKGFTLIELLVIIGIIGILSSLSVIGLNGSRSKARASAVQVSLMSLTSAIRACIESDETLLTSNPPSQLSRCNYGCINGFCENKITPVPVIGQQICRFSSKTWPDITVNNNWVYTPTDGVSGDVGCVSSSTIDHWLFRADDNSSGKYIICDELTCKLYNSGGYLPN